MSKPLAIGPHALMPSRLPRTEGVYLLCFDAPVSSANGRRVTRHYLGSARNLRQRIAQHRANLSGSRFMQYVNAAGVGWIVAHLWLAATPADERRLKRQKHAWRLCPRCNPALRATHASASAHAGVQQFALTLVGASAQLAGGAAATEGSASA